MKGSGAPRCDLRGASRLRLRLRAGWASGGSSPSAPSATSSSSGSAFAARFWAFAALLSLPDDHFAALPNTI